MPIGKFFFFKRNWEIQTWRGLLMTLASFRRGIDCGNSMPIGKYTFLHVARKFREILSRQAMSEQLDYLQSRFLIHFQLRAAKRLTIFLCVHYLAHQTVGSF